MTRILCLLCSFLLLFITSCKQKQGEDLGRIDKGEKQPAEGKNKGVTTWSLSAIEGSELKFRNGKNLDTKLHDLNFIGQVAVPRQEPFLIYSGRYCNYCDARQMLYLAKAGEPAPDVSYGKNRMMHPGIMTDSASGDILYKARTFYGQVLENTTGLIWYQESLSDYGSYIPNIFLIKLTENGRTDTSFAFSNSYLQQTMNLFERGLCKEIQGREYISEP